MFNLGMYADHIQIQKKNDKTKKKVMARGIFYTKAKKFIVTAFNIKF